MREFYWVYIIECSNGSLYTGYAVDIVKRYSEHVTGSPKSSYTRSFKPVRIAGCWRVYGNRGAAMKIELLIKKLHRDEKKAIIESPHRLVEQAGSRDDIDAEIFFFSPGLVEKECENFLLSKGKKYDNPFITLRKGNIYSR